MAVSKSSSISSSILFCINEVLLFDVLTVLVSCVGERWYRRMRRKAREIPVGVRLNTFGKSNIGEKSSG